MAISASLKTQVSGIGADLSVSVSKSGTGVIDIDESIATTPADIQVNCAIDISKLQFLVILSDQAMTLKTNSSSVPQETIVLAANIPLVYDPANTGSAAPFADDVTAFFATNGGSVAASLKIKGLLDVTP